MRQVRASYQHPASSSPPTDRDLLPNMDQLHGLSRGPEGKSIPGQKLDSSPFAAAINKEEKEPPWSRKQSRGGMGNGERRGHRHRGAGQAGGKSQLQAGPDCVGHTDVPTMVWQSWVRALQGQTSKQPVEEKLALRKKEIIKNSLRVSGGTTGEPPWPQARGAMSRLCLRDVSNSVWHSLHSSLMRLGLAGHLAWLGAGETG